LLNIDLFLCFKSSSNRARFKGMNALSKWPRNRLLLALNRNAWHDAQYAGGAGPRVAFVARNWPQYRSVGSEMPVLSG
jgi:hypothetical protein